MSTPEAACYSTPEEAGLRLESLSFELIPHQTRLFLDYLRDGVIVGHHIGHDIEALNCACERHFQIKLNNRSLDTMDLTLHLKDDKVEEMENHEVFMLDLTTLTWERQVPS